MTRRILSGNQAVALGALRAGVRVVTGYPGTPSTGCLTHLLTMDLPDRHVEWSTNEKVAFEIAAGAAWAGHRAMCTMKMSGLNVTYDALISIAYSGTNGGLVFYVADDPGVSAGMAEQDSRGFALMSHLPMLEPATPAEAYELVQTAFELSEAVFEYQTPFSTHRRQHHVLVGLFLVGAEWMLPSLAGLHHRLGVANAGRGS